MSTHQLGRLRVRAVSLDGFTVRICSPMPVVLTTMPAPTSMVPCSRSTDDHRMVHCCR
jgi:hypothetical protein